MKGSYVSEEMSSESQKLIPWKSSCSLKVLVDLYLAVLLQMNTASYLPELYRVATYKQCGVLSEMLV